ncbi:hypothetical protein JTE90_022317 [Oedothorax gibbosus]|uniref:Uncharacterized protein n=1 Tax=Oedothorax gibbosus TaxID=931172 RepID=A0AAV6VYA2_9ARAC|nr:hypothetical protein JTE90_022317 [Oedothorax gibbosus]
MIELKVRNFLYNENTHSGKVISEIWKSNVLQSTENPSIPMEGNRMFQRIQKETSMEHGIFHYYTLFLRKRTIWERKGPDYGDKDGTKRKIVKYPTGWERIGENGKLFSFAV